MEVRGVTGAKELIFDVEKCGAALSCESMISTHKDEEASQRRSCTRAEIPPTAPEDTLDDAEVAKESGKGEAYKGKKKEDRDAWCQTRWPMKGKAIQARPETAEAGTQTATTLPSRIECLWQPHPVADTLIDVSLEHIAAERVDAASASGTMTEPEVEAEGDKLNSDGGPGWSHPPLMSQAEAKPTESTTAEEVDEEFRAEEDEEVEPAVRRRQPEEPEHRGER